MSMANDNVDVAIAISGMITPHFNQEGHEPHQKDISWRIFATFVVLV